MSTQEVDVRLNRDGQRVAAWSETADPEDRTAMNAILLAALAERGVPADKCGSWWLQWRGRTGTWRSSRDAR